MFEKIRKWYRSLPEKKQYLEFVTAALSVPVLITVIMSNVNNLAKSKEQKTALSTETKQPDKIIIITQEVQTKQPTPEPSSSPKLTESLAPTATPTPTNNPTPTSVPSVTPIPTLTPTPTLSSQ